MDRNVGYAAKLAGEVLDVGAGAAIYLRRVLASQERDLAPVYCHL
jgi:hypothetical protein